MLKADEIQFVCIPVFSNSQLKDEIVSKNKNAAYVLFKMTHSLCV